jgi:hypothetical protein
MKLRRNPNTKNNGISISSRLQLKNFEPDQTPKDQERNSAARHLRFNANFWAGRLEIKKIDKIPSSYSRYEICLSFHADFLGLPVTLLPLLRSGAVIGLALISFPYPAGLSFPRASKHSSMHFSYL